MKKIIILILCILNISYQTNAFLGEDLGADLYNSIDEGIDEIETKQFEYELSGQGEGIKENINNILELEKIGPCLGEDASVDDIKEIALGNLEKLNDIISDDCKNDDESISIDKLKYIQETINNIYILTKNKATSKSKQINNISRIGVYSDGSIENSPFDIMTDLEDIDKIIFTNEIIYEGENYFNNDDLLEDLISDNLDNDNSNYSSLASTNTTDETNTSSSTDNTNTGITNTGTIDTCVIDSIDSGLSTGSLNNIYVEWNDVFKGTNTMDISGPVSSVTIGGDSLGGGYKSVNDNSEWPCDTFFCIAIDFITYSHDLLGGGQDVSIEYLINRSNNHLKNFVSTSLMQATMSINNFESILKNINLPDMFHMGIVIESKPVPMLELEDEDDEENDKDKEKFTNKNLLKEYYKNMGLEYDRKNDLHIFSQKEEELKTMIDSATLTNNEVVNKFNNLENVLDQKAGKNEYISKAVFKKVYNDELSNFENQFIELRKFTSSIRNYTISIDSIIREMNKIPIEN